MSCPQRWEAKRTPNCGNRGAFVILCPYLLWGELFGKSLHFHGLVAELKVLRLVLTNWYWQELVVDFVGVQNWDQNNCDGKINGLATEPHQT